MLMKSATKSRRKRRFFAPDGRMWGGLSGKQNFECYPSLTAL